MTIYQPFINEHDDVGFSTTTPLITIPPKFLPATNFIYDQSVIRESLKNLELIRQIDVQDTMSKHLYSKLNQSYLYTGLTTEKLSYRELFEDEYLFVKGEITKERMSNLKTLLSSSEVPFFDNCAEDNIVIKTCRRMSRLVEKRFPLIKYLQFNQHVDSKGYWQDVVIFTCKRTKKIVGYFLYNNGSPIMLISENYE